MVERERQVELGHLVRPALDRREQGAQLLGDLLGQPTRVTRRQGAEPADRVADVRRRALGRHLGQPEVVSVRHDRALEQRGVA